MSDLEGGVGITETCGKEERPGPWALCSHGISTFGAIAEHLTRYQGSWERINPHSQESRISPGQ